MKTVKLRLDIGCQNDEPVPNVAQPQTLLRDTCPADWPSKLYSGLENKGLVTCMLSQLHYIYQTNPSADVI